MRLFVDDLRVPTDDWTLVRTNTEAIRLLAGGYVDQEISIDHDIIACYNKCDGAKMGLETFIPIIYYIIAMKPEFRPKKIIIHTANPAAAIRMEGLLSDAGIESEIKESNFPFSFDNIK